MNAAGVKIDLSDFHEILAEPNRWNVLAITANASGHISPNANMRNKLQWKEVVFSVNSTANQLLIKQHTNESNYSVVPPKSAIAASKITQELVRRGVRLPARYVMYWDDECQLWLGILDKASVRGFKGKNRRKKNVPALKDLV